MTPGQTHPRRRGLNELMESVAAKLAERPDHIAAARVLEEMQADAAKISHKADGVDVHPRTLRPGCPCSCPRGCRR